MKEPQVLIGYQCKTCNLVMPTRLNIYPEHCPKCHTKTLKKLKGTEDMAHDLEKVINYFY